MTAAYLILRELFTQLPEFFVKFLTDEQDVVIDIFGGSNNTGAVCERLSRRWLAFELEERYLEASKFRFPQFGGAQMGLLQIGFPQARAKQMRPE